MYSYFVYGIGIKSEIPLPGLEEREAPVDAEIRLGHPEPIRPISPHVMQAVQFEGTRAYYFSRNLGACLVLDGTQIIGEPFVDADNETLGEVARGPGLSVLLHQRGCLTLHASSVCGPHGAVTFIGESGSGKSFAAATLHTRGYELLADEFTVIDTSSEWPVSYPGFPGLRLWPDAADRLGFGSKGAPGVRFSEDKPTYLARMSQVDFPAPVSMVYFMKQGLNASFDSLEPQRAVFELVRNCYWIWLSHDVRPESHLRQCAQLVTKIPVRQLTWSSDCTKSADFAKFLEDDIRLHCLQPRRVSSGGL